MSRFLTLTPALLVLLGMLAPHAAGAPKPEPTSAATEAPDFSGSVGGNGRDEGLVEIDAELDLPGGPGTEGTSEQVDGAPEPEREGAWISVPDMVFVTDPPCIRMINHFFEGATEDEAEVIRWTWENQFVAEYEAYISAGNEPPLACDGGDGFPGFGPTPGQQFTDSAEEILPAANPTISGGYAITGLRSWLDLGRPSSLTTNHDLTLGTNTVTATITATATATVDWGDGTITTHTARGGGYHDGDPGPADITHTYRDAVDSNTLTVTDTWDVTIEFPDHPAPNITLNWSADPVAMSFPIREVRSSRDR